MKALLQHLPVKITTAATGTIYIYHEDIMIRIGDHEPNFDAPRRQADHEIYTHNIEGTEINNKYDVFFEAANILGLEIPDEVTEEYNSYLEEQAEYKILAISTRKLEHEKMLQGIEAKKLKGELFGDDITAFIQDKQETINEIIIEAEAYGEEGSTGDKKRKRRRSYFKQELEKRYGCYFELSNLPK